MYIQAYNLYFVMEFIFKKMYVISYVSTVYYLSIFKINLNFILKMQWYDKYVYKYTK